ncbi:hypothetical protein [Hymenobacter cellulosilyticus]|uniref:Uncharacterized protein n=1 Tax=Hymenobacter cellulosilyticus TaxID=2932248 RepID=A0A8T9Q3P9_9BACT|nr:hypothetical protein [Hymenobacter cellulosilyticus]UOQ72184.1 hypothetical protein MUN79_27080 [Hymenobacter cellulosilyticus]
MMGQSGGSGLLLILLMCLVLGCVLVSQQAIPAAWPGVGPGNVLEAGWLRLLALTWWVALELLRVAWWALNVLLLLYWLLSVADDGRPWYS